jgi:hypothetical protein
MALINNWDLKDVNNSIYQRPASRIRLYLVKDVGATFGTTGYVLRLKKSRGNLQGFQALRLYPTDYVRRKWISPRPDAPHCGSVVNPPRFIMRMRLRAIGDDIPRADAKVAGRDSRALDAATDTRRLSGRQLFAGGGRKGSRVRWKSESPR